MFSLNKQNHNILKDKEAKDNNLNTIQCDRKFFSAWLLLQMVDSFYFDII